MNLREFVHRLYNAGFDSRQASDIVLWMGEPFKYYHMDGLAMVEEVYTERLPGEGIPKMTGAQYRSRLAFQTKIIDELREHIDILLQFRDIAQGKAPQSRLRQKKVGVTID